MKFTKICLFSLFFVLFCSAGVVMAEPQIRRDFVISNLDEIIDLACRDLVEQNSQAAEWAAKQLIIFDDNESRGVANHGYSRAALGNQLENRVRLKNKFMNFDKSKDEHYISAVRGKFGDWVAFIVPDRDMDSERGEDSVREYGDLYNYYVFKYPSLDIASNGGQLIKPDAWEEWHRTIDSEEMNPNYQAGYGTVDTKTVLARERKKTIIYGILALLLVIMASLFVILFVISLFWETVTIFAKKPKGSTFLGRVIKNTLRGTFLITGALTFGAIEGIFKGGLEAAFSHSFTNMEGHTVVCARCKKEVFQGEYHKCK